ncbi:uncharacterized protein LOC123220640 isoform X2 [Mangifera indica]|uniref:uncharacterized protein LOC123220640 isoform X2 n=1 Tax=Mangifera indica TaxID=29780 RepID=UPI001CFB86A8|nr:uncharacterized protein LOC123220640 isoform X2 [Mangifera indica]
MVGGGGAAAQQTDTEMAEAPSDLQQPPAVAQAAGIENIPATLSHGGWYIQDNIFGNIFEVTAKYRPPILSRIRHRLGLGLQVIENVEEADFILVHGTKALGLPSGEAHPASLEDFEKILELCAAKKIPMILANPDYVTVEPRALRVMPSKFHSLWYFGVKI